MARGLSDEGGLASGEGARGDAVARGEDLGRDIEGAARGRRPVIVGALVTLAGCACWGFNGTLIKYLLETYPIDATWLVCVRELSACWLFLLTALLTARERVTGILREPRDMAFLVLSSLLCILSSNLAYAQCVSWTNSATATVLQATNLVLVMAYVCVVTRRPPRRREVAGALLALGGTFLLATGGDPGSLLIPREGLMWGAGCALSGALLSIMPTRLLGRWGSMVFNGYAMLISGLILAVVIRPWEHVPTLEPVAWALIGVTVVVGTYGSYALFLEGVRRVGSMRSALLGTAEPLTAMLTSVVMLGMSFSPTDLVGFAMIIVMVFLTA